MSKVINFRSKQVSSFEQPHLPSFLPSKFTSPVQDSIIPHKKRNNVDNIGTSENCTFIIDYKQSGLPVQFRNQRSLQKQGLDLRGKKKKR